MIDKFWDTILEYEELGFDPLRWIPVCSNEIERYILESSLREIKRTAIKIEPRWFDAFYYTDGRSPELTRRVYNFNEPEVEREVEIGRALSMFRIHTETGEDPVLLSCALRKFLNGFHSKTVIKKISTNLTVHPDAQYAILDYVDLHRGSKVGYIAASNSTTQITDATQRPDSEIHSNIALTTAMENLNLVGCTSGFKLFPAYDAPNEELLDMIRKNLDAFTSRYNLVMEDYSSLKVGKLFFGATAIANTIKELPTRYDQVEEGMQIIVSDKFGTIPALSLYMLTQMDPNNITKIEQNHILPSVLSSAKDEVIKTLTHPSFSFGKIISRYCPDFGAIFDKYAHITAVYPVMTDGIFAIERLAELTNSHIVVNEIPIKYEEIAKYTTREFLIDNATASSNGCHLIVAPNDLARSITDDLIKHGFEPAIIGFIAKKERPFVAFEKDISQYVASSTKLNKLNTTYLNKPRMS
ncbi:MAG TPA: SelD-related putative sulfur metabolism protein [Nitrososphaeraceae archaeon]|nr:SelD-related putative sulfur metabolism protein [Nitrososphaeraceae archaeon]